MTLLSELQSLLGPSHVLTGADADGYVQGLAPPLSRRGAGGGTPRQHG